MSAVLVVEDEKHLANGLRFNLEAEGYRVELAADGEKALERLKRPEAKYDAVILDVMLPGVDGFQVASELRQAGVFTPILMLTARGQPQDVMRGFECGADDYLPKPFDLGILLARLRGLLRRHRWSRHGREAGSPAGAARSRGVNGQDADEFVFDGKRIDFSALELHVAGQAVRLTAMEAELLRYLVQHAGKAISRKAMLRDVWGLNEETDTRAIDNFIVRLRRYIEKEPSHPRHLLTVRSVGYRFVAEPGG